MQKPFFEIKNGNEITVRCDNTQDVMGVHISLCIALLARVMFVGNRIWCVSGQFLGLRWWYVWMYLREGRGSSRCYLQDECQQHGLFSLLMYSLARPVLFLPDSWGPSQ